ncbi:MAG: hypothetical protein P1V20_29245 [Verrucomicrobiales bacterium]|nr:hypothetical protein [Verrucomicrobiales bacterium]
MGKHGRNRQRPEYRQIGASPKQLGEFLQNREVILLGEIHCSQAVLNVQKEIFAGTDSELLGVESAFEPWQDYKSKDFDYDSIMWGTVDVTRKYADESDIRVVPCDVPHHMSKNSSTLGLGLAKERKGAEEQLILAFGLAGDYLKGKRLDYHEVNGQILDQADTAKERLKLYLKEFRDDLPRWIERNLKEVTRDFYLEYGSRPFRGLALELDQFGDNLRRNIARERRLQEADPHMAAVMSEALQAVRQTDPDANASIAIGARHMPGVERALEKQGYDVVAVNIVNTSDPAKDGCVFVRTSTDRDIADYVVTVFDPEHPEWNCATGYDLQADGSRKAVDIPRQQIEARDR